MDKHLRSAVFLRWLLAGLVLNSAAVMAELRVTPDKTQLSTVQTLILQLGH